MKKSNVEKQLTLFLGYIKRQGATEKELQTVHPGFRAFFDSRAAEGTDGLYPTVTIRQIMWALKMKPIPKHPWETVFDHSPI